MLAANNNRRAKVMKTVFNSSADIVHLFAQRTQNNARCSNMFFEHGTKLYSYSSHYLLAEFKDTPKGNFILIDNRGYSNTTAKHISQITQATRQYKQYFTLDVDFNHVERAIKQAFKSLQTAKKPELYIPTIINKFESLVNYPLFDKKVKSTDKFKELQKIYKSVQNPELLAKAKEKQKAIDLKAKKLVEKQLKESLAKFYAYEIDSIRGEQDFVRLSECKEFIETSQRVKISVNEAKALYNMILAKKDIKGHRIGGYVVTSLNSVLTIGCHRINLESINKVGKQLLSL